MDGCQLGQRCTDWHLAGVTTDAEGRVIRLDLSEELAQLDITGSIPAALGQLTNLQVLWLRNNDFSGCIPASLEAIPNNDLELGLSFCDG